MKGKKGKRGLFVQKKDILKKKDKLLKIRKIRKKRTCGTPGIKKITENSVIFSVSV